MWISTVALLAHITWNPNIGGASGGYFHSTLRVPHGAPGLHTTQLNIQVPHGILVAKPEVPEDWSATITTRPLSTSEEYLSHGQRMTTAPDFIELKARTHADGVHDDFLLNIDVQLKIGCVFEDSDTNTLWNKEYTLWWKIDQICEDSDGSQTILSWNGTQQDNPDGSSPQWSALPDGIMPAPYMYIEPGSRCQTEHSGHNERGGLNWFDSYKAQEWIEVETTSSSTTLSDEIQWISFGTSLTSLCLTLIVIVSLLLHSRKKTHKTSVPALSQMETSNDTNTHL